jgi:hypothetical protein
MGVRLPSSSSVTVATIPAAGTEGVVLTSPALSPILDGAVVFLFWMIVITPGAAVTAINTRLRRGTTITSTQVDTGGVVAVTAGSQIRISGCYFDSPGIVANQQYVLTAIATGGAATSAVSDGALLAMVL